VCVFKAERLAPAACVTERIILGATRSEGDVGS
jgi:hypothetical protein